MNTISLEEAYAQATELPWKNDAGLHIVYAEGLRFEPVCHFPSAPYCINKSNSNCALITHVVNMLPTVMQALVRTLGILSGRDKAPMAFEELRQWDALLLKASTVEIPK